MAAGTGATVVTMAATAVVTMEAITEATMAVIAVVIAEAITECIAAASIMVADDIGEAAGIPMALGHAGGGIRILAVGSGLATDHERPLTVEIPIN